MEWLNTIDFSNPLVLILVYLTFFAIIFLRYLIFSGAYYMVFLKMFKNRFSHRLLVTAKPKSGQLRRELILSIYSALIFGFVGLVMVIQWKHGLSRIYSGFDTYSIWYFPLSLLIFLLLHDTYYYWLHKWMHTSKWMRKFHMEHQRSIETTVLTSFAFHPIESVLQVLFLPSFTFLIPINEFLLLVILGIMTISSVFNHAGVEVYFKNYKKRFIKFFFIGATHHDIRHRNSKKKIGLYFTFWDKVMNTNE